MFIIRILIEAFFATVSTVQITLQMWPVCRTHVGLYHVSLIFVRSFKNFEIFPHILLKLFNTKFHIIPLHADSWHGRQAEIANLMGTTRKKKSKYLHSSLGNEAVSAVVYKAVLKWYLYGQ